MNLESYIKSLFPDGLNYKDSAQLCIRLYSCVDDIPSEIHEECNKNDLTKLFAKLSTDGYITGDNSSSVLYGASFHDVGTIGHWVEVIASIYKKELLVDGKFREKLDELIKLKNKN